MEETNDYKLEFQQLKAYYNFRVNLKKKLEEVNDDKYDKNQYYLIDKKWLQNWKKHVGYNYICQERFNLHLYNKEINDNDYINILPFLKIFCDKNTLFPLVNNDIYVNGEINPLSDFIFVDKNCYDLFVIPNNLSNENNQSFPIIFFNGNILLKLKYSIFTLSFKIVKKDKDERQKEIYWELILIQIENVNENLIINYFTGLEDILDWLKKYDINLDFFETKEVDINGHKIKLVNKTLIINKKNDLLIAINPQTNNELMREINYNTKVDKLEIKKELNKIQKKDIYFVNKEILYDTAKKEDNLIRNYQMNYINDINNDNMNYINNMNNMNYMNNINNMNAINNTNNQINQNNINNQMNAFHNIKNIPEISEFTKIIKQKENPIYPHRTGLQNLGETSYMNSAIQCLSNIKYLSDYLINHFGKFDIKNQPLYVTTQLI